MLDAAVAAIRGGRNQYPPGPGTPELLAALGELVIVAPEDDSDEAVAFAARVGARRLTVSGPSQVAEALTRALDRPS